jgi:DNA-binding MarR family transcriptional regulator
MNARTPPKLLSGPPPSVMEALRNRLSGRELQSLDVVFAIRRTAQQMDNAITEWMADSAASPARFMILVRLWAARPRGVPHKEIVAGLDVTRATVSGLMAALERDGLVRSVVAPDDRRNLLASLTSKGDAIVEKAFEVIPSRVHAALAALSADEMATLTTLLQHVRQGFSGNADAAEGQDAGRDNKARRPVRTKTAQDVAGD